MPFSLLIKTNPYRHIYRAFSLLDFKKSYVCIHCRSYIWPFRYRESLIIFNFSYTSLEVYALFVTEKNKLLQSIYKLFSLQDFKNRMCVFTVVHIYAVFDTEIYSKTDFFTTPL